MASCGWVFGARPLSRPVCGRGRWLEEAPLGFLIRKGFSLFSLPGQVHCEPQNYRPMHHKDFKEDLRTFRLKSRTWAGEKSKRELYSRLKNL